MCDSIDYINVPPTASDEVHKDCVKCKLLSPTVFVRRVGYCQQCFMTTNEYRFRVNIGKSTIAEYGSKVLLGFSASDSSFMLLKLLENFQQDDQDNRKKLKFREIIVAFIDTSCLFNHNQDDLNFIQRHIESMGFKYVSIPIHSYFSGASVINNTYFNDALDMHAADYDDQNMNNSQKLDEFLKGMGKLTSKEEAIHRIKMNLLLKAASDNDCKILMTADTCTRLAIRAISETSQGRGSGLPLDMAVETNGYNSDVVVLRPLKDTISKEVQLFNQFSGISGIALDKSIQSNQRSIERLTTEFILGLDVDFPSTVTTITKTLSKVPIQKPLSDALFCSFCNQPTSDDDIHWRKKHALSKLSDSKSEISDDINQLNINDCENTIAQLLCYACQNMVHDANEEAKACLRKKKDIQWILPKALMMNRQNMKKEIQSFLL